MVHAFHSFIFVIKFIINKINSSKIVFKCQSSAEGQFSNRYKFSAFPIHTSLLVGMSFVTILYIYMYILNKYMQNITNMHDTTTR